MSERRELLIDAFNVMFAHARFGPLLRRDLETARTEFLRFVQQNRPADATRVYVVFDAHRDRGPSSDTGRQNTDYSASVHVVYARETADVWIQRRIREHADPSQLTVVTSDNAIIATVRAHGSRLLRVSQFLQLPRRRVAPGAGKSADKPEHVSRREIEEWERLFGERRDDD